MIGEERLRAWRKAAPGFVRRQSKNLRQLRYGFRHRQQLCFVFGCQRSGTKMLMRILDNSPATRIYHENNVLAFDDFQLRSDAILRTLTRSSPAPSQIFKPICDSHKADRLLERFPDANGLWIYRHYDDVANSARQKWGAHQRDVVAAVATGDLAPWGWRTEGISAEVTAEIRRVYRPDLLEDEGALLFWYLRNSFFFALGLDQHPRMLLVKYEELVRDPEHSFPPVFAHVGAPYDPSFLERVHAGSVGRKAPPRASAEIRALCEGLQQRLDAAVRRPPRPVPVVSPVLMLINTLATGGAERYVVTVANWLADQGARVIIAAEHGELVEQLRPSIVFQDTDLRRVRGRLPVVAGRIRELIQREKPAVILGNSLVVTGIARAALPLGGVPVVNVAHGWPAD
ncbi:MAG TPA: glycosyltransferase, partial [Myxococcota bacterium]|nr:glycosyltransferase [Myxococcota bacterium]